MEMTKREFYDAVIAGEMTEAMQEMAKAEIVKMDTANEKRRNTVSKKAEENAPLIAKVVEEVLGEEPVTATDIAGVLEISVQKASYLARAAVADGKAVQVEVKVPKKGKQKGYTLA